MFVHYRNQFLFALLVQLGLSLFAVGTLLAQEPIKPKILFDFASSSNQWIQSNGAKAKLLNHDTESIFEITTDVDQDYPSVSLKPSTGNWDLSQYDCVKVDITNPQDQPVRILLAVENPNSNGRENVSVESITLAPMSKATLTTRFGVWHGEINRKMDSSKVALVKIMLDRPKVAHTFRIENLRAASSLEDMTKVYESEYFRQLQPALGRGINLGNMLDAPKEGEWGVRLEDSYFDEIKKAGFDSVRIPVRWSSHTSTTSPYQIAPEFMDRVEWVVDQALKYRLKAVLNVHHYEELFSNPDEHRGRFLMIWKQIAERFKGKPPALTFEVLNEPQKNLDAQRWNQLLVEAIRVIRVENPNRTIIVGPVDFNSIDALQSLVLPEDDRNLTVTFHYYSPFPFTHQGANWIGADGEKWLGTKWTGTPLEKFAILTDLNAAISWAVEHKRPIYMGEFGAYEKADMESRVRWTKFLAEEALKRNIGFAYWEFAAGFGVFDPQKNQWREPLKNALLSRE